MVLEIIKTLEEYRSSDVSPTVRRKLRTHKIYDRTQYDLPLGRVIVDNTVEMVYFMYTDPDFAICISFVDTPMIEKLVNEFIQSPYKPSFPSSPASNASNPYYASSYYGQ